MHGRENLEFVKRGWINDTGDFHVPDDVIEKVAGMGGSASGMTPTSNPASGGTGRNATMKRDDRNNLARHRSIL